MPNQRTTILSSEIHLDHLDDAAPRDDRAGATPTTSIDATPARPDRHDGMTPLGPNAGRSLRRTTLRMAVRGLAGALALLVFGAVAGPYVYIHFIEPDPPKPLTFETTNSTPTKTHSRAATGSATASKASAPTGVAGAWNITVGSTVGYRVHETLMGQDNTAVGRTTAVTGNLAITNTKVRSAAFTVNVTNVTSDNSARDRSYAKIMQTATYPTATFTLTAPITLATIPADLVQISVPVIGNLTLHGVTKPVTFTLNARRNGSTIEVNGLIPIVFSDYEVANPSLPGISVGNKGALEFLLVLTRVNVR